MNPNRLGIMSKKNFKSETSPGGQNLDYKARLTKGITRGAIISLVDASLDSWDRDRALDRGVPKNATKQRKTLRTIAKSCAYWLNRKAGKDTALSSGREHHIKVVLNASLVALGTFDPAEEAFARRKIEAIRGGNVTAQRVQTGTGLGPLGGNIKKVGSFSNPNARALHGQHALEREHYLSAAKPKGENWAGAAAQIEFQAGDNWNALNAQGYMDIYKTIKSDDNQTAYLPKRERLQYLTLVDNDQFTLPAGGAYNTNRMIAGDRIADMWAMDRYGNLFLKSSETINGKGFFNHSSFNAGNEVICAGVIMITAGQLAYIDNASGHYKPTEQDLMAACVFLRDECGVIFADVCRGVMNAAGTAVAKYRGLTNTAWNPAHNALRNLPADIQAQ